MASEYVITGILLHNFLMSATGLTFHKCNSGLAMRNLDGDILLAGLFPLTYYKSKQNIYVQNTVAITWVEAFTFAVRKINKDDKILPGVKVGFDIRNSCNKENTALKNVLDFILDLSMAQNDSHAESKRCGCQNRKNRVIAVVGGASSSVSTSVSNVLSADDMPQISYSSTSMALSNKNRYPNFLRTLPSDIHQAKAIVALLKEFSWTYVSVFASDDDYGRLGFYQLEKELKLEGMCLAEFKIFKRKLNAEAKHEIIEKLRKGLLKNARVVILWCQVDEAKTIIEESWRQGLRGITWLGCETLGDNEDLFELKDMVRGFVGLKPTLHRVKDFEEYLNSLTPLDKTANPWMKLYWKSLDNCELKAESNMTSVENTTKIYPCGKKNGSKLPRSKYSHVISAVFAVLKALDTLTGNMNGTMKEKLFSISPRDLYNQILKVDYRDPESELAIKFDEDGDPAFASYTFSAIIHEAANTPLHFVDIGSWDGKSGKIEITYIPWDTNTTVESQCSTPCNSGMFKIPGDVPCCWTCVACKLDSIATHRNVTSCIRCDDTSISNENKTKCLQLQEIFFTKESGVFKVTIFGTSLAIVCVTFVSILFIKYWTTPVVKSANRELSMLQLFMIFVSLWYPVSYWMQPSTFQCIFQSIWLAFCPTTILAVTCVKTYRLYRIFNKKTNEESRLLRNKYQTLVVLFILLLQTGLALFWFQYYNVKIVKDINRIKQTYMRNCCDNTDILLVVLQCYNLGLALVCAFMAFRARKLPNAFNEARYITFGTFTYCITWMFAIPLFFSLNIGEKKQVSCAMNTISSFALFLCFFANKVHVILFLPEQNTKQYFTRQATANQFARTRTRNGMTSSWPSLPGLKMELETYPGLPLDKVSKHLSTGSVRSMVSVGNSNTREPGTCNPRALRRYERTPKDILFARYGRERSQTFD